MKIVLRILLLIFSLFLFVGLLFSLSQIYAIPWLSDFVHTLLTDYSDWFPLVLAIILVFFLSVIVVTTISLCLRLRKEPEFMSARSWGKLYIAKESVASVASIIIEKEKGVRRNRVRVKGKPQKKKVKLYIDLEIADETELITIAERVKKEVSQGIADILEIDIQAMQIKMNAYSSKEVHETPSKGKHMSRVV